MFSDRRYQEIAGILVIAFAVIILLALSSFSTGDAAAIAAGERVKNSIGPFGSWVAASLRSAFGCASYILSAILGLAGWFLIRKGSVSGALERIFALTLFVLSLASLLGLIYPHTLPHAAGGYAGLYLAGFLRKTIGDTGAFIVIMLFNLIVFILLGILSINLVINSVSRERLDGLKARVAPFIARFRRVKEEEAPLNSINGEFKRRERKPPWIEKKRVPVHPRAAAKDAYDDLTARRGLIEFTGPVSRNDEVPPVEALPGALAAAMRGLDAAEKKVPGYRDVPVEAGDAAVEHDDRAAGSDSVEPAVAINRLRMADLGESVEAAVEVPFAEVAPAGENQEEPDNDNGEVCGDRAGDEAEDTVACRGEETGETETTFSKRAKKRAAEAQQTFDFGADMPEDTAGVDRVFEEIPINREYIIPAAFLTASSAPDVESWKGEVVKNSELLVATLREFGIESRVVNVNRGPVITLYEMQIAPGIKVNRIVSLSDDIAMALAGSRVRIVAPIPGKSAIGVEVPNRKREMVNLGDIVSTKEYRNYQASLKVALGKDILGIPLMIDLKKQPHLLIAGATGSGKSVCVNAIILSLLYNYDPNYLRFIMVDPKMVELQLYNGIPHLLTPVITEPGAAPKALKWAMYEMERRYRLLSQMHTRDIERYNQKASAYGGGMEKLPYIVIIMDELADLMMVASKEIEGFITRIAQKARAVGIHLVLATQRPSVDVITGVIKANFPARIAFQVAQKTDSRTIIDQNGADKLLGKGDMLYQSPMSSFPVRVQGAFTSEEEVMAIVRHLRKMGNPSYIDIDAGIYEEEMDEDEEGNEDELFVEALKIVEETKKASASYLQRRLSIGYNRAARIIELMEERGYIGAQVGSKPREVFI